MNNTHRHPNHEAMTTRQAEAVRIAGDRWVRSSDVGAHADAEDALACSIARARALQRMLDDESARLTPLVLRACQSQLEDMVQGVRQELQAHFEERCRALESAMLAVVDALLDEPRVLVGLVVSMTEDHLAEGIDHRFVLELPDRFKGQPAAAQLLGAHVWDTVEYRTGRRTPALRVDMRPLREPSIEATSRRWLLDPDTLRSAVRQSFQRSLDAPGSEQERCE